MIFLIFPTCFPHFPVDFPQLHPPTPNFQALLRLQPLLVALRRLRRRGGALRGGVQPEQCTGDLEGGAVLSAAQGEPWDLDDGMMGFTWDYGDDNF